MSSALDQAVANQLRVAGAKCVINGYTRAQRSGIVEPIVERDSPNFVIFVSFVVRCKLSRRAQILGRLTTEGTENTELETERNRFIKIKEQIWIEKFKREKRKVKPGS
jgi:hypothetical protein